MIRKITIFSSSKFLFSLVLLPLACNLGIKKEKMDLLSDEKPVVVFFLKTDCPICQKYQGGFKLMNKKYESQVTFYYIFPNTTNTFAVQQYCQYDSIDSSKIILENNLNYTQWANATATPQAVIVYKGKILYSGKIDDRFMTLGSEKKVSINYVENALNSLLKNEAIAIKETNPVGCLIEQ